MLQCVSLCRWSKLKKCLLLILGWIGQLTIIGVGTRERAPALTTPPPPPNFIWRQIVKRSKCWKTEFCYNSATNFWIRKQKCKCTFEAYCTILSYRLQENIIIFHPSLKWTLWRTWCRVMLPQWSDRMHDLLEIRRQVGSVYWCFALHKYSCRTQVIWL